LYKGTRSDSIEFLSKVWLFQETLTLVQKYFAYRINLAGSVVSVLSVTMMRISMLARLVVANGGQTTDDYFMKSMNLDPSQPGNQDIVVCNSKTTKKDCYDHGCQWWYKELLDQWPDIPSLGEGDHNVDPAGMCRPCASDTRFVSLHPASGACNSPWSDVCTCGIFPIQYFFIVG